MTLPALPNWLPTAVNLQQAVLLFGLINRLTQPRQEMWLQLAVHPTPTGLQSPPLAQGGKLALDLTTLAFHYTTAVGQTTSLPLANRTQRDLLADLITLLGAEIPLPTATKDGSENVYNRFASALAERDYEPPENPADWLATTPLQIDKELAAAYAGVQYRLYTAVARFRARLRGTFSPLVVWPHHFDLSFLTFQGAELDDYQPHVNIGFAPYSDGLDQPYLYAYAYPYPDQYDPPALPAGGVWHTSGWTGVVIPYDTLAAQPDPEAYVEASCAQILTALQQLWP